MASQDKLRAPSKALLDGTRSHGWDLNIVLHDAHDPNSKSGKKWPTPQAMDQRIGLVSSFVSLRNPKYGIVPTPTAFDSIGSNKSGKYGAPLTKKLRKQADEKFPTPRAMDGEISNQWSSEEKMEDSNYSPMLCSFLGNFSNRYWVNPEFSEWLMGWPIGWTQSGILNKEAFELWKEHMRNGIWWVFDHGVNKLVEIDNDEQQDQVKVRLKAIGNGQVPMCVYIVWKLLEAGGAIKNGKFMKNTKPKIQAIIRGDK